MDFFLPHNDGSHAKAEAAKPAMVAQHPLAAEIQDQIFRALGQAVAKVWSELPQEIQTICSRPPWRRKASQ
jgi:hypothetical protein